MVSVNVLRKPNVVFVPELYQISPLHKPKPSNMQLNGIRRASAMDVKEVIVYPRVKW